MTTSRRAQCDASRLFVIACCTTATVRKKRIDDVDKKIAGGDPAIKYGVALWLEL
jgi:hypothetical protein